MNDSDDEPNNKILFLIFPILLAILLSVAYVRLPAVRTLTDSKVPWFRAKVGHYLLSYMPGGDPQGVAAENGAPGSSGSAADSPDGPRPFDIAVFSTHPESWPKTVVIKKETEFPAVLNNKKVGTLRAPAGSQVHLVSIQSGKLGVEFQGGGAWVAPEATDLIERVRGGGPPQ